jgi:membrane protein YqaA with SNARE-associated domain
MEQSLLSTLYGLLAILALPEIGLSTIFIVSMMSATFLPLGSEPAVFAFVKLVPDMFWAAILVATVGNTIGGAISYGMGLTAQRALARWKQAPLRHPDENTAVNPAPQQSGDMTDRWHRRAGQWLHRLGPPALLLSWLPVIGDPLCAVAGWLRLPFWPCTGYMAVGKLLRYVVMTAGLMWFFPPLN